MKDATFAVRKTNCMKKSFRNDIKKLGLPTISLKINDTPFRFLVDSGSTENYITKTALNIILSIKLRIDYAIGS